MPTQVLPVQAATHAGLGAAEPQRVHWAVEPLHAPSLNACRQLACGASARSLGRGTPSHALVESALAAGLRSFSAFARLHNPFLRPPGA
eukprot:359595-Chlamydomonas_euryale.AAC.3